jgi:hypothetical protein
MKGMTRDDFYIIWKMVLKGSQLGSFARCLPAYDCSHPCCFEHTQRRKLIWNNTLEHTWPIFRNYPVNDLSLYAVDNVVTDSRNQMSIWQDCDFALGQDELAGSVYIWNAYLSSEFILQGLKVLGSITGIDSASNAKSVSSAAHGIIVICLDH